MVGRLFCLSGFYDYGLREVELLGYSPVANVRRPRVGEDSPTIGLDATELNRLLAAAERDSPRSAALIALEVHAGRVRVIRMPVCHLSQPPGRWR